MWVKQLKRTPDVDVISLDDISTTIMSKVEAEKPIVEEAPKCLDEDELEEMAGEDHIVSLPLEDEEIESETTLVPHPLPTETEAVTRRHLKPVTGDSSREHGIGFARKRGRGNE
jgi:hypothetical protein